MNVTGAILVAACAVFITHFYWHRLSELEGFEFPLSFWNWFIRGVAFPLAALAIFSTGWIGSFPPLVEQLGMLKGVKSFWRAYIYLLSAALIIVATYWTAISLLCMAGMIVHRVESKAEFLILSVFWSVLLLPICYMIVHFNGWPALGAAVATWLVPVVASTAKSAERPPVVVSYSKAEASLKFGKYDQAELEVIEQLERDANDFEGWMKLAEIYARHFKDLAQADQTVRDLCEQPDLTTAEISMALDTLATWHLTLGKNPSAARAALEFLCQRLPESHAAHMAQMRLKQLPRDRDELIEQEKRPAIRLPGLREDLGDSAPQAGEMTTADAAAQANRCVDILKRDPNDAPAREKLALLLAENLGNAPHGIDQLRLLMDVSGVTERQKAKWLGLIAAWQLNYLHDRAQAEQTCRRLIAEYPESPEAFAAQRRLNLMEMEQRMAEARARTPANPV